MYPNTDNCEPCPSPITPNPIPDFNSILCNTHYNGGCAIYTGPDIDCLDIKSGMDFNHISQIFCDALNNKCDIKNNCVLSSDYGPWGECTCVTVDRVVTCTQTRTQLISIPASNGGTCFPAVETRDCTPKQMCFQFSGGLTETPDGAYFVADSEGYYNGKTYYQFVISGNTQTIWYSTDDHKWHLSSVLGTPNSPCDFTLDNNSNDYPVSNTTDQLWHNPSDGCNLYLLQSSLTNVPDTCASEYKICIELKLTIGGRVYKFKNLLAPSNTPFGSSDHPQYLYSVDAGGIHNIHIYYDGNSQWIVVDSVLGNIGSLNSSDFYPVGTWIPNPASPDSQILTTTLGGTCVQDPDVDCYYACGPWSTACILKPGTTDTYINTRTCTAVGPTGNGNPCPPAVLERGCVPPCTPPTGMTFYEYFFKANTNCNPFASVSEACSINSDVNYNNLCPKSFYALNLNIGTRLYLNKNSCTAPFPDGFYVHLVSINSIAYFYVYQIVNSTIQSITKCCNYRDYYVIPTTFGCVSIDNSSPYTVLPFDTQVAACNNLLNNTPRVLFSVGPVSTFNINIGIILTQNGYVFTCTHPSETCYNYNCNYTLPPGWYTYVQTPSGIKYTVEIGINSSTGFNYMIQIVPCVCTSQNNLTQLSLLRGFNGGVFLNETTACTARHSFIAPANPIFVQPYILYGTTLGIGSQLYTSNNSCGPKFTDTGWYSIYGEPYNTKVHTTNGVVDVYEVCTIN